MKRLNLNLVLLLVAALFTTSCDEEGLCIKGEGDTETRVIELESFNGVRANGNMKVYITQGPEQHVEIKGQPNILNELETSISDNVWRIEFDRCIRKHKTVEVYITVPTLTYVEVNGSGTLEIQDKFEMNDFHTYVNGSGDITAQIEAEDLYARISGSGNINVSGQTKAQRISISGSGKVRAFNLESETAEVDVSGSGDSEVKVSDALNVKISGSGKVYYKGNPAINVSITGSGKLIKS